MNKAMNDINITGLNWEIFLEYVNEPGMLQMRKDLIVA